MSATSPKRSRRASPKRSVPAAAPAAGSPQPPAAGSRPKLPLSRLPYELREQLCARLRDGATWRHVSAWLAEQGHPGVNAQNVTNFRQGPYRAWLKEQDRLEETRQAADAIRRELEAHGFTMLDKAAADLANRLTDLEDPARAAAAVATLKRAVTAADRTGLLARRTDMAAEQLQLEKQKFRRHTCELFLEWYADQEAGRIAGSNLGHAEKLEQLGKHVFGDEW